MEGVFVRGYGGTVVMLRFLVCGSHRCRHPFVYIATRSPIERVERKQRTTVSHKTFGLSVGLFGFWFRVLMGGAIDSGGKSAIESWYNVLIPNGTHSTGKLLERYVVC
jgi:hypothetical protein